MHGSCQCGAPLRGGSPTRRFARSVWRLLDTRAAVEEGIVPGGGVAYLRCLKNLDKLARTALQNAASVASLILTTMAMIADRPKKKLPADGGGMSGGMDEMEEMM